FDAAAPPDLDRFRPLAADDARDPCLSKDRDAMLCAQPFDELRARTQTCAAMDERHGRADFGEQQSVLDRRIAAADDAHILARHLVALAHARLQPAAPRKLRLARHAN